MRKKTNFEFIKEVRKLVGNSFIPITSYKGNKIKVAFYHVDCGKVFYMSPNSFLRGQRCPSCGVISRTVKQTYTQKEFDKKIAKVNHGRYVVLSKYKFADVKLDVRCLRCGRIFHPIAHNLFRGTGCPYCNHAVQTPCEEFNKRVKAKNNGQFEFLEPYIDTDTSILCHCKRCDYKWRIAPHSFYCLKGCPRCQTNHVYTTEEFQWKLDHIFDGDYKLIDKYEPRKKLRLKHTICNHEFYAIPALVLNGHTGCPYCNQSRGERYTRTVLDGLGIQYIQQYRFKDCKYKRALPFDFYLPDLHIAIEYDGTQHYQVNHFNKNLEDFKESRLRDHIKDWYCQSHGIYLIRIPYKINTPQGIKKFLKAVL